MTANQRSGANAETFTFDVENRLRDNNARRALQDQNLVIAFGEDA